SMQIYVVKQGDYLAQIAQTYGTTPQILAEANELEDPSQLVVGETLVIPIIGRFYFVQPGDTLTSIGKKFDISPQQLAQTNQLSSDQPLPIGLRLYIPQQSKPAITANAYIEPYGDTVSQGLVNAAQNNTPFLSYLAPFSYRLNNDGSLHPPPLDDFGQIAGSNGASLMLVITNLRGGQFSTELGGKLLTDQTMQNNLLDNRSE